MFCVCIHRSMYSICDVHAARCVWSSVCVQMYTIQQATAHWCAISWRVGVTPHWDKLSGPLALNADSPVAGCRCHTVAVVQKSPSWLANQRRLPPTAAPQIHFIRKFSPLLSETPPGEGVTTIFADVNVFYWGPGECESCFYLFIFHTRLKSDGLATASFPKHFKHTRLEHLCL